MKMLRLYTGDDGESHFEDVEIDLQAGQFAGRYSDPVRVKTVIFRETDGDYDLDYHTAPRRQFVINLRGSVELETGLGEKRQLGPGDILLAEDTTGRGHRSRAVNAETRESLFIPLAD
jgi:uncharacterized cupin superfamily protein